MADHSTIDATAGAGKTHSQVQTVAESAAVLGRRAVERLEESNAITLAWQQVDAEELAAVLRAMPAKVRNRMLSSNRTPSSKVTVTTARLLITNVLRRGGEERFRAARVITAPFARDAEDEMHEAVHVGEHILDDLSGFVTRQVEDEIGASVAVLCAVSHAAVEPSRFLGYFIACRRIGIVPDGPLGGLADELASTAGALIEEFEANHRHNELEIEEFAEPLKSSASSTSAVDVVDAMWIQARDAARRVHAAVRDGLLPEDGDIDIVRGYVYTVTTSAEAAGVEPTIAALAAEAKTSDRRAALDRLSGPGALAESIASFKVLLRSRMGADEAERLEVFARLVAENDPMRRMELAASLRPLPPPPAPELVDAALVGVLYIPDAAEPVPSATDEDGATALAYAEEAEGAHEKATVSSEQEDHAAGPEEPPAREGHAGETSAPDAADVFETLAALQAASSDGSAASDAPPEAEPAVETEQQPPATPASTAAVAVAVAEQREGSMAAPDDWMSVAKLKGEEAPSEEKVAATMAGLVAAGRFDLAHHLACASQQGYRAAVLREAALAEAVRTPASPASVAMVASAAEEPLRAADLGSVVLRAASEMRVALLDPGCGGPTLLRDVLPCLEQLPAFRDLVAEVVVATEQMVAVSASGLALDVAAAVEEAEAIAQWAREAIDRPPLQNKLYRGIEIWKAWTAPDGPLGRILALLARNNPASVGEVREATEGLSRRSQIERAIEGRDRELRAGRSGNAQKIIGPAKQQLIRHAEEIVVQAQAWCDAQSRSTGSKWSAGAHDALARAAGRVRSTVLAELDALCGDPWLEAATRAASASISATLGLLANEGLAGDERSPLEALNACLALVSGLPLDVEFEPKMSPTLAQLVAAASCPRRDAFRARLDAGDFFAAEALIHLRTQPCDELDAEAARAELAARERDALARTQQLWGAVDAQFSSARARGRIGEEDAARIYGAFLAAQPSTEEGGDRRDLGCLTEELEGVEVSLRQAVEARRGQVTADVISGIDEGHFGEPWNARLRALLQRDELGAAEEYLYRAQAGEEAPSSDETEIDREVDVVSLVDGFPGGIDENLAAAAETGSNCGPVDFSGFDAQTRAALGAGLRAWLEVSRGERPADLQRALRPLLGLLGLIPQGVERPPRLRAAGGPSRWFVEVIGGISGYSFVPDFGSRSGGRRRFLLCWDTDLPMSQLWDAALTDAPADAPVYVLYMSMLSAESRRALAREARSRGTGKVVVIDDAVVALCAAIGRQAWDVTMRAILPYAAPNPYDPDFLVNTPEEMFYGRRIERQKVMDQTGTSFISGGRRFGKSALLRAAEHRLAGSDVLVLLVTIQNVAAAPPYGPDELWPVVGTRLVEAGVLDAAAGSSAEAITTGIRAWLKANPERRLLLLLDECDFFLKADSVSRFSNVVILRDLMSYDPDGRGGRFKVVFSGLQHVARYRKLPNQPLSHLPQPLVIGPLDPSSASRLVRRPLRAMGWQISDSQIDRLVTFCACNPSVLQLACMYLVDRLRHLEVTDLAPWAVPDKMIDDLVDSRELDNGVRDRLFLTLRLDHRYMLLANLVAWRALHEGGGGPTSASELRALASDYWPEGFAGTDADDVRALCDELVGLGVFAGDAEAGYRMLSPATLRLFGSADDIDNELMGASENYISDITAGAAGSRISLGDDRFSPLSASQLADVIGMGRTQLRIVVGSRALRAESVPLALAKAVPSPWAEMVETSSLRQWRDAMTAPREGHHRVVVADMTGRSMDSWDESIDVARPRGAGGRAGRGTRAAVLVAGPHQRWLLSRFVGTDVEAGHLPDLVVGLRRFDMASLQAWDRIEEIDLAHPRRQARLLEVTGGWPLLVERIIAGMHQRPFEEVVNDLESYLDTAQGAKELLAAAGLDPDDRDQAVDAGVLEIFERLVETDWRDDIENLAGLLELDDDVNEQYPVEALAILRLLAVLTINADGICGIEPVIAAAAKAAHRARGEVATLSGTTSE